MSQKSGAVALRASRLFAAVGGLWLLFSDRRRGELIRRTRAMKTHPAEFQVQTALKKPDRRNSESGEKPIIKLPALVESKV